MHKENLLLQEKQLTKFTPMIKFLLSSKKARLFGKYLSITRSLQIAECVCSTFSRKTMIAFKMHLF